MPSSARRQPPLGRPRSVPCEAALAPRLPARGVRAPVWGNAHEPRLAVRLCKGSRRRRRPVAAHVAVAFAAGLPHAPAAVNPREPRHAADPLRAPHGAPRVSPSPAQNRIIAKREGQRIAGCCGQGNYPAKHASPSAKGNVSGCQAPARGSGTDQGSRSHAYPDLLCHTAGTRPCSYGTRFAQRIPRLSLSLKTRLRSSRSRCDASMRSDRSALTTPSGDEGVVSRQPVRGPGSR